MFSHPSDKLVDFTDFFPTICEAANIPCPDSLELDGRSFLPILKGDSNAPHRQWIYSWYARSGKEEDAQVFARNQRYKLYQSGDFYDIAQDYYEEHPLPWSALDTELTATRDLLQAVLDYYQGQRLNKIPSADR